MVSLNEGDDAQAIVRWDFIGRWNWGEVEVASERSVGLRISVPHKSSIILNFEQSESLPMGAVTQMIHGMSQMPERREMVVIAGSGVLLKNLVLIFLKVRRNQSETVGLVDTLEEARAFIAANKGS